MKLGLALAGDQFELLKRHLYPGDGKEAVALALCGRSVSNRRHYLTVQDVLLIEHADCRERTPGRVNWPVERAIPLFNRAMEKSLSIVKFHSHPSGFADFSSYDDQSDEQVFAALDGYLDTDLPQASVILLPDGRMVGRAIRRGQLGEPLSWFRVAGDDFRFQTASLRKGEQGESESHGKRIQQTFGDATFELLKGLRVGVVGSSGTGSIVIEQLARNCVGELVVVEPGKVKDTNLNRILNSTKGDALAGRAKAAVARRTVRRMGTGTVITVHECDIFSREAIKDLADCDVLFGCVDSIDGRHLLNKLATYYLVPYIDLGVRIDADGKGGIQSMWGAVHTLLPGRSSLLSRGVYSAEGLTAAFLKSREGDRYRELQAAGYIKNQEVERPAVISLNMLVAATAMNEFLARLHPFRFEANSNFAQVRLSITDPESTCYQVDGQACPTFSRWVGRADTVPLLGYPELG